MASKSSQKRQKEVRPEQKTKKQIARSRKEARQNRIILIGVGAAALLIIVILSVGLLQELVIQPNKPVAIVNGNEIPTSDYQDLVTYRRYNQYLSISNLQNSLDQIPDTEDNAFLISFYQQQLDQLQSSLALLPQTALDEIIEDELVREKAVELDLTVTDQEVEQSISDDLTQALTPAQQTVTDTEQVPTPVPPTQDEIDELYQSILDNMTLSDKSFRNLVKRGLLRSKVQEALAAQVPTTGLVSHVQLIQTETEEEALAAKERIEGGEEFSIVAQEVSTDTVSAEAGGDLGWVTVGQLSGRYGQEVEDMAFSLPVGELGMTQSSDMYYVILVVDRNENGPLPPEVLSLQQNSALSDWLEERKTSPEVSIERLLTADQIPADPFVATQSF